VWEACSRNMGKFQQFASSLDNDQLDALNFVNTFITILYMYMFRAISCSSSGGQTVLIQHLVSSLSVSDRPVQSFIQGVQLKRGPYFNMNNLFTKIYNMLYYTTHLYLL